MRQFVYFSSKAPTSGNFGEDLMKAGRLDIAIHSLIQGIFLSHDVRKDVKFHFIFYGMPDPPKHIEIQADPRFDISKKDVANLIKRILYKYKEGKRTEVLPGCFVEKKSFLNLIDDFIKEKKEIFILDKKGESLRKIEIPKNSIFIIGDHEGLPKKEIKRLKKVAKKVSIGQKMYFASQVVTIINNELDLRSL